MGPGLTTLTRMRREASSRTQHRARLRTAALVALYTLKLAVPFRPAVEPVRITFHQRQGLLHREEQSLHVRSKDPVDVLRGDGLEREHVSATSVREHHVEATRVPRDLFVKPVEIREVRHVGLDTNAAAPDRTCGVRDLGATSSSDEESYTLSGQLVR